MNSESAHFIGCAGWTNSSEMSPFSTIEGGQLQRYSAIFDAVEINSSFYRAHRQSTYERWAASVPNGFKFSVKLPKAITHTLKLSNSESLLEKFLDEISGLGKNLGCVLVQLPPSLVFDTVVASQFFERFRCSHNSMIACEARNPTWFTAEATDMLKMQSITRVKADPTMSSSGDHGPTTASTYIRLHGSPHMYYSSYSDENLEQISKDIDGNTFKGEHNWIIFDNSASGAAINNALTLLALNKVGTKVA